MSMCTSDPFPTFGADIPVDGSILRPFGVPEMIKSCMNLCPKKGLKIMMFPSKKVPFGSKKGSQRSSWASWVALGCSWSAFGALWATFGPCCLIWGPKLGSQNGAQIDEESI